LDYTIEFEKGKLGDIEVPKMFLVNYIENAIKHGFAGKKENKLILIEIKLEKNKLICLVKDNGIGRKAAKELGTGGTGHGFNTVKHIYYLYYKLTRIEIIDEIIDIFDDDNNVIGTEVKVIIPLKS